MLLIGTKLFILEKGEGQMRMLIVDDSLVVRQIIKAAADSLKYEFLEAPNGLEAIEILKKLNGKIDLILLDWNMPQINGYEFLKIIKSNEEYKSVPVIMVATETQINNILIAIKAGAIDYITKPFTMDELIKKIKECIGGGRFGVI